MSAFSLQGKTAFVTGGGGGLGSVACATLARAGAAVAVVARSADKCEAVAKALRDKGGRAVAVSADVLDQAQINAALNVAEDALGPIDILVNNAGVTSPKGLLDLTVEDWDGVVDVSMKGTFLCTQAVARGMIERRRGRIINMGSILSERGVARRSAYSAAKAGLANFTRACAVELGPHGITVNALGPTVIVTDLNRTMVEMQPELYRAIVDRTPLGRLGETSDLEGPLVFLASDAAAFVSGQILYVDGGYTAS
ncbi:NAD(P)-dependent dehydrogenase (short-subunit alcohol dehydrogenase family) [Rhodoligotrophos appendicifer]|uniref:SDR family NAD(P)-dependent oxidoreductase n=1 Tax=Rhodoligotrophos appendicifer TaxID=987056 RepID=UPI00117CE37E|nr:SDR family NAD(P)-dependent oxidoreductase [Rhodoligotrophos appendicifer]